MGFIESIGWLTIIFGGVCFVLIYLNRRNKIEHNEGEFIQNNKSCQDLINTYNQSVIDGRPIMSSDELKKKLRKIIKDPQEKQNALDTIKVKYELNKASKQTFRNKRKVGYRYEIDIFEIFGSNRELAKYELLSSIKSRFNIDDNQANEILKLWRENQLVEICPWNIKNWEIGDVLTHEYYKLDEDDLTRQKWLDQHGVAIKPISKEYRDYLDKGT